MGIERVFARLPSQVERVDRDAVAAKPWSGIIGRETERLGRSGIDNLVDVDTHSVRDDLHLVDQADIDGTLDVFEKLGQFRGACRTDRHHLVDDLAV